MRVYVIHRINHRSTQLDIKIFSNETKAIEFKNKLNQNRSGYEIESGIRYQVTATEVED